MSDEQEIVVKGEEANGPVEPPNEEVVVPPDGDIMMRIPDEVMKKIFSNLTGKDIASCSLVCKRWADLLKAERSMWMASFFYPRVLPHMPNEDLPAMLRAIPDLRPVVAAEIQQRRMNGMIVDLPRTRQHGRQ